MDDQEDASKQERKIAKLDTDEDVTLEEVDAEVTKDADETDEAELAEVEEVIEVVISAKLMTEVVTATTTITAALVPKASTLRRRMGVIIQDPKEASTASLIVQSEVKRKEWQENTVMRYQALKRKPVTEAHARKNMMAYLKNMTGFKMDFFRGMTDIKIRPIFKKHYNSIEAFLEKEEKEIEEEGSNKKVKVLSREQQRSKGLMKRKYPLTRLTLEQMLNNVRLEVKEKSEMSLELLRLMRRQQQEGSKPE
uniref:Uncharacterized protein n=1 Tax=Tanacetum cinerariifolium TaxID=118510 RepID=A0A699HNJ9_TANCI|nr:hypothetical protein [Tanacetum cinerariifolium]